MNPLAATSVGPKEESMYNDGFVVAVILGLLALVSPMLWIGWWLVADLGENANSERHERTESGLRRAA